MRGAEAGANPARSRHCNWLARDAELRVRPLLATNLERDAKSQGDRAMTVSNIETSFNVADGHRSISLGFRVPFEVRCEEGSDSQLGVSREPITVARPCRVCTGFRTSHLGEQ